MTKEIAESLDQMAWQVSAAQIACLGILIPSTRLVIAIQKAWSDLWIIPMLQASAEIRVWQKRQARTARLIRRGVPASLAQQGLRLL